MKLAFLALLLAGCAHSPEPEHGERLECPAPITNKWNESPEDLAVRRAIERINSCD
jgi:hypothetical protein